MLKPTPRVKSSGTQAEPQLSLRELFDQQEGPLLRYAFSLIGRRAIAEEIVQAAFLQLHAHWDEVELPKAWLMRCVRNKAYTYLRQHKREVLGCSDHTVTSLASIDDMPEESFIHMETTAAVRMMLEELDDADRQLVKLKYFDELKYVEISERLGLTVGNVGYRLHHILIELARKLRRLGIDETL